MQEDRLKSRPRVSRFIFFADFLWRCTCCKLPQRLSYYLLDNDATRNAHIRAFIVSFVLLSDSPSHKINSLEAQLALRVFVPDQQPLVTIWGKLLAYRLLKRLTKLRVSVAFIQMQMKLRPLRKA